MDVLLKGYSVSKDNCQVIPPVYDDNRFFPVSRATRKSIRQLLNFERKVALRSICAALKQQGAES